MRFSNANYCIVKSTVVCAAFLNAGLLFSEDQIQYQPLQYREQTIAEQERLILALDSAMDELTVLRKTSPKKMPTITPELREKFLLTFRGMGYVMDDMASEVREYAKGKPWQKCDEGLPELQKKRLALEKQWVDLAMRPLNTERERLSAAAATNGQVVTTSSVLGGFTLIPVSCHFENMGMKAKESGLNQRRHE